MKRWLIGSAMVAGVIIIGSQVAGLALGKPAAERERWGEQTPHDHIKLVAHKVES